MFTSDDLISVYTRAQAIEDDVLVDVSETAKEAGLKFPVALTAEVWNRYVKVPAKVKCQDEAGRLWDILAMMRFAIRSLRGPSDRFLFSLHVRNNNRRGTPPKVQLKAICGPGDNGEPVITVMLPSED